MNVLRVMDSSPPNCVMNANIQIVLLNRDKQHLQYLVINSIRRFLD
jgi:hypothetical protein